MKKSLKTKGFLFKRHIITDVQCPRCGYAVENILLVLRDCFHAKKVWSSLLNSTCRDEFFNISLENWIVISLSKSKEIIGNVGWQYFFVVVVWRLWFWRNQAVFFLIITTALGTLF